MWRGWLQCGFSARLPNGKGSFHQFLFYFVLFFRKKYSIYSCKFLASVEKEEEEEEMSPGSFYLTILNKKQLCKYLLPSHWLWLDHVPIPDPVTVAVLRMARPELHASSWTEECRLRMAADPQGKITFLLPRRQGNRCWLSNSIPTSFSKCVDIFGLYFARA